jgi:creatinine amidohydrolase
MQWEQLTATEFAAAVRETGVCVIAMGVVEKHSEHLPLGTDYLFGHALACRAAEIEPAVVFPPFYLGQIYEARCFPGTLTIPPWLLIELTQSVFDEIGRNGFKKVVVLNAHGGNTHFLRFLAQAALWEEKPYSLYIPMRNLSADGEEEWLAMRETSYGGHACEQETSGVLGTHPHLVHMDRVPQEPAPPIRRPPRALCWRCPHGDGGEGKDPDPIGSRVSGAVHCCRQGRRGRARTGGRVLPTGAASEGAVGEPVSVWSILQAASVRR